MNVVVMAVLVGLVLRWGTVERGKAGYVRVLGDKPARDDRNTLFFLSLMFVSFAGGLLCVH